MSRRLPRGRWSRDQAITFIRLLEKQLAPHYHVALAGSVLMTGASDNDLDLLLFPHRLTHNNPIEIGILLRTGGLELRWDCPFIHEQWRKKGSDDLKFVQGWFWQGYRVDIFQPYYAGEIECPSTS